MHSIATLPFLVLLFYFLSGYSVFSAPRRSAGISRSAHRAGGIRRSGNLNVGGVGTASSALKKSPPADKASCVDNYVNCMDALIPYVLSKNSFFEKDEAVVKMQNSDKLFRCVYDDKVKDLFDRYNFNCVNDSSKMGKCSSDNDAFSTIGFGKKPSVGEVTPSSIAYYRALQEIVKKGKWNKLDIAIFDDLGLDKGDLSGGKSSGVINIAATLAIINPKDELNISSGICLNGENKNTIRGLDTDAVKSVNSYITALNGCKQYEKELSVFYKNGMQPKQELCSDGSGNCSAKITKNTFLSASKSCTDYENALMATRVEWQGRAKAVIADNASQIKRELMAWINNETKQDVALNNSITNLQNDLFRDALDKFKECMRTSCRSGGTGEYEGCVDINGLVQSKILDAGLRCYPEYKITVNTTAQTLNKNPGRYGKDMEEMLENMMMDDEEYIKMSINAVKTQISEAYMKKLQESCENASGSYDNEICFWQLVRKSEFHKYMNMENRSWDGNKAAKKSAIAAVKGFVGASISAGGMVAIGAGKALEKKSNSPIADMAAQANPKAAVAQMAGKAIGGGLQGLGAATTAVGGAITASAAKDMIDINQANRADANGNRAADDINARMKKEDIELSDSYIVLPGTTIACDSQSSEGSSSSHNRTEGSGGFMNFFSQHAGSKDDRRHKETKESISEKYFVLVGGAERDACTIGTFIAPGWGQALERANMTDLFFKLKSQANIEEDERLKSSGLTVISNINEIKYNKSPKAAIETEFETVIRKNWAKLFVNR